MPLCLWGWVCVTTSHGDNKVRDPSSRSLCLGPETLLCCDHVTGTNDSTSFSSRTVERLLISIWMPQPLSVQAPFTGKSGSWFQIVKKPAFPLFYWYGFEFFLMVGSEELKSPDTLPPSDRDSCPGDCLLNTLPRCFHSFLRLVRSSSSCVGECRKTWSSPE